jgi:hypothetical protein
MTTHPILATSALGVLLSLAACAVGSPEGERQPPAPDRIWPDRPVTTPGVVGDPIAIAPQIVTDDGAMCLYPAGRLDPWEPPESYFLEAGDRLRATVTYEGCLSKSCDINRVASCDFRWDGDVLLLKSRLTFDEVMGPMCTLDCGTMSATCESDPLPAGEILVQWGERLRRFTVPSEVLACKSDECSTDADCPEMCADDGDGYLTCQLWARLGEACAGFDVPPQTQCAPGLVCVRDDAQPDAAAICLPACDTDEDCDGGICVELDDGVRKACISVD